MKKQYEDSRITIFNADYKVMVHENEKADLILADPPYIVGIAAWDFEFDFEEMLRVFADSIKPSGSILIFNTLSNVMQMAAMAEKIGLAVQSELVLWRKTNPQPTHMRKNGYTTNNKEYILWLSKVKKPYYTLEGNEKFHDGIFEYSGSRNSSGHPCEKPKALIEDLLLRHSKPNDLIFDPFSGSGVTVKACKKLKRRAVAWELDKKWFDNIEL
ncbi:site-specific DNA-methyltransferase [Bacillus sp. S0628]|uniref:DNA-methyltransferase n=1 Tax=Bacillus sp. S0628 TaxID=2957802 RepID=UPI0020A162A7|nr:site-specific DNA-methyltransferase [Bacillus sp. S0628]MCP1322068.1 site-specific DNA-methyltransferase [Bacillus sp. S0628]